MSENKQTIYRVLYIPTGTFLRNFYYESSTDGWIDILYFLSIGEANRAIDREVSSYLMGYYNMVREEFEIMEDEI